MKQAYCPKCGGVCKLRGIKVPKNNKYTTVYDCQKCKDQISPEAVYWRK